MPFSPLEQPSIGLSLLKQGLTARGWTSRVTYCNLRFARIVGPQLFNAICQGEHAYSDLLGERLFSQALFDSGWPDESTHSLLRSDTSRCDTVDGGEIGAWIETLLQECCADVLRLQPKIVGFSSVFQQHLSSLALAKRIKGASPSTTIVFGGANCEGAMGLETLRQFVFVDVVVSGEADLVFPDLVESLLHGRAPVGMAGVLDRRVVDPAEILELPNARGPENLDELPIPDYSDYFEQLRLLGFQDRLEPRIPVETSRGCWWGQHNQCSFCGLNGRRLRYRQKTPERAYFEITELAGQYPTRPISAVDNVLSPKYFGRLFPLLAEANHELEIFYEVRPTLSEAQLIELRSAGVGAVQAGIESLSNGVLRLMKKGTTRLGNIQFLRNCEGLGIAVGWNLLYGYPGESPREYEEMARILPFLAHLPPPTGIRRVRLDRFSPMFEDPHAFGFGSVRPFLAYKAIYPFDDSIINNLAYHFTDASEHSDDPHAYVSELSRLVEVWKQNYATTSLFYVRKRGAHLVWDLRPSATHLATILTGAEAFVHERCGNPMRIDSLAKAMQNSMPGTGDGEESLLLAARRLVQRGLLLEDRGLFLTLAIPLGAYSLDHERLQHLVTVLRREGHTVPEGIALQGRGLRV